MLKGASASATRLLSWALRPGDEPLGPSFQEHDHCRHGATEHSKTRTTAGLLGPAGFRTEYESAMGTRTIPQMTVSGMWGAKSINNSQTLGANVNDPSDHLIKVSVFLTHSVHNARGMRQAWHFGTSIRTAAHANPTHAPGMLQQRMDVVSWM